MTTIRQYQPADKPQLKKLALQNYVAPGSSPQTANLDNPAANSYFQHIIDMQEKNSGYIFVAESGKTLIGFVCLMGPIAPSGGDAGDQPYAFMSDLFVTSRFRKQGVGTLLVRKIEDQARSMGIHKIALRVAAGNKTARQFYTDMRYSENFIVMSKDIEK